MPVGTKLSWSLNGKGFQMRASRLKRMVGKSKVFLSIWFPQLETDFWEAQRAWNRTWLALSFCGELGQVRAIVWTHGWPSFRVVISEVTKTADDKVSKHDEFTKERQPSLKRAEVPFSTVWVFLSSCQSHEVIFLSSWWNPWGHFVKLWGDSTQTIL